MCCGRFEHSRPHSAADKGVRILQAGIHSGQTRVVRGRGALSPRHRFQPEAVAASAQPKMCRQLCARTELGSDKRRSVDEARRGGCRSACGKPLAAPAELNRTWALDFMGDTFYDGRRVHQLTILDEGKRALRDVQACGHRALEETPLGCLHPLS